MYDAEIAVFMFVVTGSNWMYPVIVSLPDIFKLPVREVKPIKVFDPVVNKLPVTVWLPTNMFEPVVAKTLLSLPSNKSEFNA